MFLYIIKCVIDPTEGDNRDPNIVGIKEVGYIVHLWLLIWFFKLISPARKNSDDIIVDVQVHSKFDINH